MRPPLNAGENPLLAGAKRLMTPTFNEAPAERGGKHGKPVFNGDWTDDLQ